jgi:hypothetical protein
MHEGHFVCHESTIEIAQEIGSLLREIKGFFEKSENIFRGSAIEEKKDERDSG